jgi:hypothetical protein
MPWHPCNCDRPEFPCSHCAATPPDPLPLTIAGATDTPVPGVPPSYFNVWCPRCSDLNGSYLLPSVGTCWWRYAADVPCEWPGVSTIRLEIDVRLEVVVSPNILWWSANLFLSGYDAYGGNYSVSGSFFRSSSLGASPIDCSAESPLPWFGAIQTGRLYFCNIRNAVLTVN